MEAIKRADMNREEATATCDAIRLGFRQVEEKVSEVREQLLILRDRNGWIALGYSTWRACVADEFTASYRHVDRQLQAALIEREIAQAELDGSGPGVHTDNEILIEQKAIPEKYLRPLTALPKNEVAEVWQEIKATAPEGKVTQKHSKAVVDRKLGKPKPEPKPAVPRSQYKTEINGEFAADPPDIAARRAAGKIADGVVVEITEPEPDEEPETTPTPEAAPGEPEEEWLANLPLSSMLTGMSLAIFQSDAKRFYRMRKARDSFRSLHSSAGKGLRKDGCYFDRISKFLTIADPRDWIRCTTPDNGGCSGTGLLTTHGGGACPKCFGRGYTIDNRRDWRKLA